VGLFKSTYFLTIWLTREEDVLMKKGILQQMDDDPDVQDALKMNEIFYWGRVIFFGIPVLIMVLVVLCR